MTTNFSVPAPLFCGPSSITVLARMRKSVPMLAFGIAISLAPPLSALDLSQSALDRADSFLRTEQRGQQVLAYLHFGADYHGHKYQSTVPLSDSGAFALIYRFWWQDDGVTDLAFLCDSRGFVESVKVVKTNAVWSQPFSIADLSIQVLGHSLVEAYKDKLSADDRRQLHELLNKADAKGLLEFSLRLDQRLE